MAKRPGSNPKGEFAFFDVDIDAAEGMHVNVPQSIDLAQIFNANNFAHGCKLDRVRRRRLLVGQGLDGVLLGGAECGICCATEASEQSD